MCMRGDKRERILRILLNHKDPLSKNELSIKAGCSRQWVILFLKELEKKKLVVGTRPIHRLGLIEYWSEISKMPMCVRNYMVKEPLAILKKTHLDYALTTYQAENLVQRFLFPARTDIYIRKEDLEKWHSLMIENGLYGKGNVKIISVDEHTMYNKDKINGIYTVSVPQLIIDLMKEGGPAAEAAEMLKKRYV